MFMANTNAISIIRMMMRCGCLVTISPILSNMINFVPTINCDMIRIKYFNSMVTIIFRRYINISLSNCSIAKY